MEPWLKNNLIETFLDHHSQLRKIPENHSTIVLRGLREGPQLTAIMPHQYFWVWQSRNLVTEMEQILWYHDWNNNRDVAYSWPRGWRFSPILWHILNITALSYWGVSEGPLIRSPLKPWNSLKTIFGVVFLRSFTGVCVTRQFAWLISWKLSTAIKAIALPRLWGFFCPLSAS